MGRRPAHYSPNSSCVLSPDALGGVLDVLPANDADLDYANRPCTLSGNNWNFAKCRERESVVSGPAGTGKAQPHDTTVWTPIGPKKMGDLKIGDEVLTPDGDITHVAEIHEHGDQDVYRVSFSGGGSTECTLDHLWELHYMGGGKRNGNRIREMESLKKLGDILGDYLLGERKRPKYWIPQCEPVVFQEQETPIDSYVIGVLLGDGSLSGTNKCIHFSTADLELAELVADAAGSDYEVVKTAGKYAYRLSRFDYPRYKVANRGCVSAVRTGKYMARARKPGGGLKYIGTYDTKYQASCALEDWEEETHFPDELKFSGLSHDLRKIGVYGKLSWNKHIPKLYKYNSESVRMSILQGLMDTDGTVDYKTGMPSFTSVSKQLAEDVAEIVESLGGIVKITTKQPPNGRLAYTCWIRFHDPRLLFRLTRKKERARPRTKYPVKRMITNIEFVGRKQVRCITLSDPNGLYLTDHFVVTHNSVSALESVYACMQRYPGMRALIIRKTRKSLTESGLVTFEQKILPDDSPLLDGAQRSHRQSYTLDNSSQLITGGCDNWQKIMSTEYDMIYVMECTELNEDEWEGLSTRLRNNVMPYQRIMGCCNPDSPQHWILKRNRNQKLALFPTTHKDNPHYYDTVRNEFTDAGRLYIASLEASLTGVRKQRYLEGLWVHAEGAIYPYWNQALHMVNRFEIPRHWPRYLSIDWGFANPAVIQWWAEDPDKDHLFRYRELYQTKQTVDDLALVIKHYMFPTSPLDEKPDPNPRAIICDHDLDNRVTLERELNFPTTAARKDVSAGIDAVSLRLGDETKPARLFFMRDSLIKPDLELLAAKRPTCTEEEFGGYVWKQDRTTGHSKDEPEKQNDHGLDAARYLVAHVDHGSPRWIAPPTVEQPERSIADILSSTGGSLFGGQRQRGGASLFGA